jgi:hydroxymethylbilane synthase
LKRPRTPLRIGTRSSALALWQTERIRELLHAAGRDTVRVEIKTTGDLVPETPLSQIGSRALFTRQIDDALLEGRIDLAVHSLKDLPTELPDGIAIGAVGLREDPSDALVGHGPLQWSQVPEGAAIATSSLRRRAQLLHLRSDLVLEHLRGNVDTRLAKLDGRPEWTAIVLATAGLVRLGLERRIGERLSPEVMLPAPGQGALAVTVRAGDSSVARLVHSAVHHGDTAAAVSAERAFLHRLEGGCQVPVAAYAEQTRGGGRLRIHGRVVSTDGEMMVEGKDEADVADQGAAEELGSSLAERLLAQGAAAILAGARQAGIPGVTEP